MNNKLEPVMFRLRAVAIAWCVWLNAAQAGAAEEYTNFLGMRFVPLPSGSFTMGSVKSDVGVMFNELPQHKVSVPGFQMMKTEVTLGQFKRYIIASNHTELVTEEFMDANANGEDFPVVYVSWNDIRGFLHWLNKNKPASDTGTYSLPSEAEWEYACRAGSNDLFCGAPKPLSVAWYTSISVSHQQAVGLKTANAFGLHDMSGNAREWVDDCYHEDYQNAPTDGSPWTTACLSPARVLRGGSWKEEQEKSRATGRMSAPVASRSNTIGFRIVRRVQ